VDKRLGGLVVVTLAIFGSTSKESDAALRYRTDAHECFPMTDGVWIDGTGMHMTDGAAGGVAVRCSLPIGPGIVDLGDGSGNRLTQVQIRFLHGGPIANISTSIDLRDNNTGSMCTCGTTSAPTPAATTFFTRTMNFNCGSCAFGTDWSINLSAGVQGFTPGDTVLKQIAAFD